MRSHERKGISAVLLLSLFSSCLAVAGEPATQRKSPAKIDYVAKLNELVKKGSDESLNADPFYRKALVLYVESPTPVDGKEIVCWPTELADERRTALMKWVEANSEALAQLRLGAQKPSCWFHYKGSHILETDRLRDMSKVRLLLWALVLRAKCEAINGDIEGAVNDLVASWRFTGDVRKRLLLVEQVTGIGVSVCAFRAGLQILDKSHLTSFQMESLKDGLMSLLEDRDWFIDLKAEEFATQDALQRLYAQWPGSGGKENTRPVDETISAILSTGLKADYGMELSAEQVYSSVYRYTPEAMATLIGEAFAFYSSLVSKTPFQWRRERVSWDEAMRDSVDGNVLLLKLVPPIPSVTEMSFRCRAERDALITALALFRYKNDKADFPADLGELVSAGYLRALPMDPYSDKPLVYKRMESNFMLYSRGADFKDDAGRHDRRWGQGEQGGDYVFWPAQAALAN